MLQKELRVAQEDPVGTIENLTRTHVALDVQLERFKQLLQHVAEQKAEDVELERLVAEAHTIMRRLERHFANESTLEEQSDVILGPGSMQDYSVGEHQQNLRDTGEHLVAAVNGEPDIAELVAQFERFVEHFAAYTQAEWDFLQANAAILYPGGTID